MVQLNLLFHIPSFGYDGATMMVRDYVSRTSHRTTIAVEPEQPNYEEYDIVLTHLGTTGRVLNKCKKPIVFISHNWNDFAPVRKRDIGVIHNAEHLQMYPNDSVVCRPMCRFKKRQADGHYITLINLNENKGGYLLREIAERLPDEKFIGVRGAYGKQIEQPENVTIVEHGEINEVWENTKLLLMPSKKESWGRTAAEAICWGIPVIATETDGVKEVCQDAAWYVDRDVDSFVDAIIKAQGEKAQKYMRALMRDRFEELKLQGDKDIKTFDNFLIKRYEMQSNKRVCRNEA